MKNIINILVDYKGYFGSKQRSLVYRSGMDLDLISKNFNKYGYETKINKYSEIDFQKNNYKDSLFIYTSQEDLGQHYKSYIEDVVLGLELQGAVLIPTYKFLKSHDNKVFMEIVRNGSNFNLIKNIKSYHFGSLEDLQNSSINFEFPVVIKNYAGAMSKGVFLANSKTELYKIAQKASRSKHYFSEFKDSLRPLRHKGYIKEAKYRNKFIVQQFIPNLKNDWKVLIYGDKYYILYRGVRKNDFRASGSGKFIFDNDNLIPDGLFDFAENVFNFFNVPNASFDVCYDGNNFYLTEFQFVYFGTTTLEKNNCFYVKDNDNKWVKKIEPSELEKVYVDSIINYLNKNKLNRINN